jgi:hypothetical protein|nr:MAG TPA: zipper dimerization domain transcription factor-like protein [Caudoviricetes sp.]
MYYIFNTEKKCICSCDFKPNTNDLATRGEIAVESQVIYSNIEYLVFEKNKIVEKPAEKIELPQKNKPSLAEEIKMLKERIAKLEKNAGV